MKQISDIFKREADRLDRLSQDNQLDADGLRRLVALTHAWKNYSGSPIAESEQSMTEVSKDALLELVKQAEENVNQTKPGGDAGS